MQLLIVHDDAEVGEELKKMVKDYSSHQCDLVHSNAAAHHWAVEHNRCELLVTQLEGNEVDGFMLGGLLSEIFPGLQTIFLPAYPAAEKRFQTETTKVFPEPIDGERLLEVIENAATVGPEAPDLFDVLDVLQMCCLSRRGGAIQIVQEDKNGIIYLRGGRIVHAECGATSGMDALLEMVTWGLVEFAYDRSIHSSETITMPWSEALTQAVRHKEVKESGETESKTEKPQVEVEPPPKRRGFFSALRRS